MTKDQLIHFISNRRADKLLKSASWSDLTAAVSSLTAQQRDEIAKGVANSNYSSIEPLRRIIVDTLRNQAQTETATALADDNLTLQELDDLL